MNAPYSKQSFRLVATDILDSTTLRTTSWNRIIVVSNRLPFKVTYTNEGKPSISPSSGGLVTAMTPLLQRGIAGKWIGWPGGDVNEEEGLEEALRTHAGSQFDIAAVQLTPQEVQEYYGDYANEVLCPAFVEEVDKIDQNKAQSCWYTYQRVQAKFASAILADLHDTDIVWVHDYHLLGVGHALRNKDARQPIGFFLHTPFPRTWALEKIPQRTALLRQMLAYDVLGFQTRTFKSLFLDAVRAFLPGARISYEPNGMCKVHFRGRATSVGHFPISIDSNEFERQLYAPDTQRNIQRLSKWLEMTTPRRITIFNTGRSDYSKGFLEELYALEKMLRNHPELASRVTLIQLVVPSRGNIDAHRAYQQKIKDLSQWINDLFGKKIVYQVHTNMGRARYLAHLHMADVLSVPTLADGMNLVAKEGAVVGKPTLTLLLSERAGAAEELGEHSLLINPQQIEEFADAIYEALSMPVYERLRRKRELKSLVTRNDVVSWWSSQEPYFQDAWDRH